MIKKLLSEKEQLQNRIQELERDATRREQLSKERLEQEKRANTIRREWNEINTNGNA